MFSQAVHRRVSENRNKEIFGQTLMYFMYASYVWSSGKAAGIIGHLCEKWQHRTSDTTMKEEKCFQTVHGF